MANIDRFGCIAVVPTRRSEIIDGHAIVEACRRLDVPVPTVAVDDLSEPEVKALRLSLNKLAEQSVWDPEALAATFDELFQLDPDLLGFTGFAMPAIDQLLAGVGIGADTDQDDDAVALSTTPVSRLGDQWLFAGGHKLLCANSRDPASYAALLGGERVQMLASDPPYGCAITGHVSKTHGEFVEGSDMSEAEALAFFDGFLRPAVARLQDGAIVQLFIDWGGMYPLQTAMRAAGLVQKALCVWDKGAGAMGSLYRQQAEFVIVAKWGAAPHINNVELGKHGRNRTTVWQAPGLAQFGKGRQEALALHPTVKPVGLVADMLLDTSRRGGVVLDPFCGSGTTLIAAHRTRRLGRGIELDPAYVDVAVHRMEAATGAPARLASTGQSFAEVAAARRAMPDTPDTGPRLSAAALA